MLGDNSLSVLKMVQGLLEGEEDKSSITPSLIDTKIGLVLGISPKWKDGLDRDAITQELIRRFSVWMGTDTTLCDSKGHIQWLTPERKREWRYWQRYREWQEIRLPWEAVDALDASTDHILGMLEDPAREDAWDRRGLVVGHVQSGKTGNYTGLISKAADAGYKIIIVLAGLHNNLRSQTQMRLDEGFLGYETNPLNEKLNIIGVGEIDSDLSIRPNFATNRLENGDFNIRAAKHLGITPEQRPWLFVVKKNKSVLSHLYKWILDHVANTTDADTGKKIVTNLPLLIIDDEADHASVDTGVQIFDDDGKANPEYQPKAINSLIRKILHAFSRKAYVGYTATPFANIFIHERSETAEEGPDLFPSAFIINLGAPSNYIGPAKVFGLAGNDGREGSLPLIRTVDDHCSEDEKSGWMPPGHKSSYIPSIQNEQGFPDSLRDAIDSFLLSCVVRKLRGQDAQHSSMLIHVTRFNAVQQRVHEKVEIYVRKLRQHLGRRIGHEPILARFERLWIEDYLPTSKAMPAGVVGGASPRSLTWEQIESQLGIVIDEISVRMINGTAKDALDYADNAKGLKVIAIGGDKLARGLTLEGLCVSYFLRASKMYDTLMQMGRWFGYRPGYLDLCRLYTTFDLVEWFEHIADASEELRQEFDIMADSGGTPRDFGLKVRSHPVLMVTSRVKMRSARSLYLSFSGSVVETVTFFKDPAKLSTNYEAFHSFVEHLGSPIAIPPRARPEGEQKWNGVCWPAVDGAHIVDFLDAYETHPEAMKANSRLLADFIGKMMLEGELTQWMVAVIQGGDQEENEEIGEFSIRWAHRKQKSGDDGRYSIGRLLGSIDETIDMDLPAWQAALAETVRVYRKDPGREKTKDMPTIPNGPAIRMIRGFGAEGVDAHPERGVLLIYLLNPAAASIESSGTPVVAFGVSFPGSRSGTKVEYKVNNVMWEQDYGDAE